MKQLVCMARCVLKKTRLLVLDEATAAMDLQTDSLIQKTIRNVFKDRTTITIAHRLDTIIFSDKILAMASGQLKEFDTPNVLLQNRNSMFNMLVEDTGPHASATLRSMAEKGPQDDDDDDVAAEAPGDTLASPADTVSSNAALLQRPDGETQQ
jgi:ABC-type multidrug transport system ATPase subunit